MWWAICLVGGIYTGKKCPYVAVPVEQKGDIVVDELRALYRKWTS